jgi:hypothetical protein
MRICGGTNGRDDGGYVDDLLGGWIYGWMRIGSEIEIDIEIEIEWGRGSVFKVFCGPHGTVRMAGGGTF